VERFEVDGHSRAAGSFVSIVPAGEAISAQATYVPHLSERREVYEFPRLAGARWVLIDEKRPVPEEDQADYALCVGDLPSLGFRQVRAQDGISLWVRPWVPAIDRITRCH